MISLKEAYEKALSKKKIDNQPISSNKESIKRVAVDYGKSHTKPFVSIDCGNPFVKSVEDFKNDSKSKSDTKDEDSIFNFGGLNLQFAKRF